MYYCQNCRSKVEGTFCSNCSQTVEQIAANETPVYENVAPVKTKKKGKVSTFIGLTLMALSDIAAVIILFAGIFRSSSMTFLEQVVDAIASSGMILFLGIWFFGLAKWIAFAVPKTFGWSRAIIRTIIPLSLFAFVAEIMVVIWLTLIPISIYGATLAPIVLLVGALRVSRPENVLYALLILVGAGVATYFLGRYAVQKLFGNKFEKKSKQLRN